MSRLDGQARTAGGRGVDTAGNRGDDGDPQGDRRDGTASARRHPPVPSGGAAAAAASLDDDLHAPAPQGSIDPDPTKGWLRRVWPLLRAHRWMFAVALGAALVGMLVQIAIPRVTMAAIDRALPTPTNPDTTAALGPFVWALAGLGVARFILGLVSRYGLFRVAYGLEYDLRALLFGHLSTLSFSFYDRVQTGQLVSRANSDIRSVQMFLAWAPFMGVTTASFLLAIVLMLQIHVWLTIVAVLPLPFVYVAGMRMRRLLFPISWVVQARLADVATIVEENVSGVRVVKSFAGERRQVALLDRAARRLRWAAVRQVDIRARFAPLMENLPRLGLALVLLYGGWLAIEGQVTIGALIAFNAYVVMLQAPFRILGFLMMLGQRAAASADRIFEILDARADVVDPPDPVVLSEPRGDVELRDVRFRYPTAAPDSAPVLDGLSLRLAPGETVALVGRTGSGKSTVARLLMRFYDVDEGAILLDGHDLRSLSQSSLRSTVGVVLDDPFLFSASIRDNIAYARPEAPFDHVLSAAEAAGAADFVADLPDGYDTVVGERGYTLSGGQRQRIAIARTLLADPAVLVLDDATSAVDVQREEEIHDALRRLMAGRTTLIIAHRLSTIALADRVALLEAGGIAAQGTHTQMLATEPRYAEVLASAEREHDGDGKGADASTDGDPARPQPSFGDSAPLDGFPGGFGR